MNWPAIGALGDLIGAVAVVVSLIYLAIQVRQYWDFRRNYFSSAFVRYVDGLGGDRKPMRLSSRFARDAANGDGGK